MVRLSPERMTVPAGLAWIDRALDFFVDASRPGALAELLAAGEIAYALHNLPGVLRQRLRNEVPLLCVFGPPAARGGPPEVVVHYDAFFTKRPKPLKTSRSLNPDDPIWEALYNTLQALRGWWRARRDETTLDDVAARYNERGMDEGRAECHRIAVAMRAHFRRWLQGEEFSRDAFVQDGGWLG